MIIQWIASFIIISFIAFTYYKRYSITKNPDYAIIFSSVFSSTKYNIYFCNKTWNHLGEIVKIKRTLNKVIYELH